MRSWLLVSLIRGYRRFVSGRGPLSRVRCTFEATESCSAYGLRAAQEESGPRAMRRILRRLERCRSCSIYRSGEGWNWGAAHDRAPDDLHRQLHEDRELASTQASVLTARALVGHVQADSPAVLASRELLRDLPPSTALIVRRNTARPPRSLLRCLLMSAPLLLCGPLGSWALGIGLSGLGAAWLGVRWMRSSRRWDSNNASQRFAVSALAPGGQS